MKRELRRRIKSLPRETSQQWPYKEVVELSDALRAIDQLDGPKVLSQKFIDKHKIPVHYSDTVTLEAVPVGKLQNLVVPKQELPVIPKLMAEWIEEAKQDELPLYIVVGRFINKGDHELEAWKSANKNVSEIVARAWLDGYTVAEEQKYYALVKGHEVIGDYANLKYWNSDTFDKRVFLGERDVVRDWVSAKMSKSEWNKLSINDSNADFVKVKEKQK